MELGTYFDEKKGTGILSTADAEGRVDSAVYARPRIIDEDTAAFIMRERLTYHNIGRNPYASYLFIEEGKDYKGVRLYLEKIREDQDPELMADMSRRCLSEEEDRQKGPKHIVYFKVEKVLPLIGDQW